MAAQEQDVLRARRFKSSRTILALVLREMSSTYGRSPGGYLWAVLEPVAAIAVLSIAFQYAFKSPALGTNFPFYFATGYLPFSLAMETAAKTGKSITFSRALLAYPAVKFTDAVFARLILNTLTHLLIMGLVLGGIQIIYDIRTIIDPGPVFLSLVMALAFGLGIGAMNCYLFFTFPMWERIWAIITRPLVLISGVIFFYDTMPDEIRAAMWYNPLVHIVGAMRKGFFATYDAPYLSLVYVFSIAMILNAFGFLLLFRHHKALISR